RPVCYAHADLPAPPEYTVRLGVTRRPGRRLQCLLPAARPPWHAHRDHGAVTSATTVPQSNGPDTLGAVCLSGRPPGFSPAQVPCRASLRACVRLWRPTSSRRRLTEPLNLGLHDLIDVADQRLE